MMGSKNWKLERRLVGMPRITFKETVTKRIEIPMDALYELVDSLTDEERRGLLDRLKAKRPKFRAFRKDKLESIMADFASTSLYEDAFLQDLEDGLRKSSLYK
jgi:hypothetical protein